MADNFKALVLSQADDKIENQVTGLSVVDLPEGDVLVRVEYSDVNYKDGMVVNGIGGLVRDYPHVPGIDFAGVVEESSHARFKIGDKVVLTGWRVGEVHWGGYAQKAREWRLARCLAGRTLDPSSDGCWYCRSDIHAVRQSAGRSRHYACRRPGTRYRCGGRRRVGRGRNSGASWIQRQCVDGTGSIA